MSSDWDSDREPSTLRPLFLRSSLELCPDRQKARLWSSVGRVLEVLSSNGALDLQLSALLVGFLNCHGPKRKEASSKAFPSSYGTMLRKLLQKDAATPHGIN